MKNKLTTLILLALMALAPFCKAQQATKLSQDEMETIVKGLKYQQGTIDIQGGLAKLNIPPDFNYLNADDAKTVLVKLWGNPPAYSENVLGMIMPAGKSPLDGDSWAVTISYSEDGYVKDDDANKIDYDAKLKEIQANAIEGNKDRIAKGYPPMEIVGWATPPHYDASTHKLYWAKELKVGDIAEHTLNYDIRILGRRGVLVLSAIAGMDQLQEIEQNNPKILSMVNFNDGNRYADFDPKVDKVAEYGLAALVVGGIAAKLGLFKVILGVLAAAWKLIAVGCVALVSAIKRLFGKRKQS